MRQTAIQRNRTGIISYQQFLALRWLALKSLINNREYVFHGNKPQLDHIFPLELRALVGIEDAGLAEPGQSFAQGLDAELRGQGVRQTP